MATKNSLIVNIANGTKTAQKVIADVNPKATNAELKAFAQGLVGLTDYSYTNGIFVQRTDIDAPAPQLPLSKASFWFGETKIAAQDDSVSTNRNINFDVTQSGVTHENGVYKFFFFIKDIFKTSSSGKESPVYGLADDTGGVLVSSREHYTTSTITPDTSDYMSADAKAWLGCAMDGSATDIDVRTDRLYNEAICVFYEIPDSVVDNGYAVPFVQVIGSATSRGWQLRFKLVKGNA